MTDVSNAIATIAPVTIAPAHPMGMGTSQPGGHIRAWRMQPAFALESRLNVIGGNLWRPGTPAHRFYEQVLSLGAMTVQECIDKAAALAEPFSAKAVQGHLRWMFTANGAFLEVDGQRYSAPVPAKPVKAATKKSKAVKPVEAPKVATKTAARKVVVRRSKVVEAA